MLTNFIRCSRLALVGSLALLAILGPLPAQAQDQFVTLDIATTYSSPYLNELPSPLTVFPGPTCNIFENSSSQVTYNALGNQVSYSLNTTVIMPFLITNEGVIATCQIRVVGRGQFLELDGFEYVPSSGAIRAYLNASGYPLNRTASEIAYLSSIDTSKPGHYVYHFRGNDALFALAQQTFGVNFTGVELLFDVQAPSS